MTREEKRHKQIDAAASYVNIIAAGTMTAGVVGSLVAASIADNRPGVLTIAFLLPAWIVVSLCLHWLVQTILRMH